MKIGKAKSEKKESVTREAIKLKKYDHVLIVALLAVIITVLLWLIPQDYMPGTVGRGIPFVWYTKWTLGKSAAQVYPEKLLADYIFTFIVTGLIYFEIRIVRRLIRRRRGQ